jgi:hypothetical protein
MLFFISREQAIDKVILMQSIGNVGFNKLRNLNARMCEGSNKIKQIRRDEKLVPKKSNKYGGKSIPNML